MNEDRFAPDEVARLLALAGDHPERRRAMADPEFAAIAHTLAEFETPGAADVEAAELEAASSELARRLAAAPRIGAPIREGPSVERSTAARGAGERENSALRRLLGVLGSPTGRGVLLFASVTIVAGATWWRVAHSPQTDVVRSVVEPGVFELAPAREEPGRLTIAWSAAPHAEAYRVVFVGADLTEIAHVEAAAATELVLRADALPAGLVPGARVSVEVVALRNGLPIANTETRPIRVP